MIDAATSNFYQSVLSFKTILDLIWDLNTLYMLCIHVFIPSVHSKYTDIYAPVIIDSSSSESEVEQPMEEDM